MSSINIISFLSGSGGTRTPMQLRPDLQSGEPASCSTLPKHIVDCPSQFNVGFELNQLSYDICTSPRTRTLTKWVGTIYASHYTNDAYVEDRERFELPNNGFAVHPLRPLRHLSFYLPTQLSHQLI